MTDLQKNAVWEGDPELAPTDTLVEELYSQPPHSFLIVDGAATEAPIPAVTRPSQAEHTLTATYGRPYQMHASLGPSASVAHMRDGKLTLWTHSQGVFRLQSAIAHVLDMAETNIHVIHRDGAGCYGQNGADDAALDAALLARALPGRPISLKWTRADEHRWEPYAPAMTVKMQASLNEAGEVIDWHHQVWSPTHLGRPRSGADTSGLLAAWYLAEPFAPPASVPSRSRHSGSHRNADPLYAFARRRIVKHHLPHTPFRTSAMRSLGAFANVFAIESFMDELAQSAGVDPVAFRLRHLADKRARAVIEAAAEKASWQPGSQRPGEGRGQGLAFAQYKNRQTYAAVVVDLHVNADRGTIRLERVVIAADAGQIINPDGLSNQLEGGFVQSASLTLMEQVLWDQEGILSHDWDSYPILRFPEAPVIEVVLLDRPHQPTIGAGEAIIGPTPAAIANAVFAAVGVRLRQIPFTPARVRARMRMTKRGWTAEQ
jgi:CO/xanthine dehydrogenase Mo-binding subunit